MKATAKMAMAAVLALGLGGMAHAADLDSAIAYSFGEFDRVGQSQPLPKSQTGTSPGKGQKQSPTSVAQSAQNRQVNAQKAEFVRRMFWVALSMR